ncbi:pilus assembly PilX N-terminal domain-containing protein [Dehalogenimonas sp. THU2]|uniref:pilus assembly PilX N-terminal domain-containing protein n=1 Tax=Dehalogenimonas sp. THU2 TaxID=3151121 RepID=UPI0032182609
MNIALFKAIMKKEKGQALILAMIMLAVGSLIIAPMLSLIGSGVIIARQTEQQVELNYAADAGFERAVWMIREDIPGLPKTTEEYPVTPNPLIFTSEPFLFGGFDVGFSITWMDEALYLVTSSVTEGDSTLLVKSMVSSVDFSDFLNNAITSTQVITTLGNDSNLNIDGDVKIVPQEQWPGSGIMTSFFYDLTKDYTFLGDETIEVDELNLGEGIGPRYQDGDLDIISGTLGAETKLTGTIYVKNDLQIASTNKDFVLDLNYQTIFVEGSVTIDSRATIIGQGAIIALGNVDYKPKASTNPDDFVFLMSLSGTIKFYPNGDFYGSLAGNVEVEIHISQEVNIVHTDLDTDFPLILPDPNNQYWAIISYEYA